MFLMTISYLFICRLLQLCSCVLILSELFVGCLGKDVLRDQTVKENVEFVSLLDTLYTTRTYSKTCVRQPPLKLTLVVDVERWLSYKGTCHLLAKLHDMYLYKTDNFFPHLPLFKVSLEGGSLTHVLLYLKTINEVTQGRLQLRNI